MVPPIVRRFTLEASTYPVFMPCVDGVAPSTLLAQPMEREKLPHDALHGLGVHCWLRFLLAFDHSFRAHINSASTHYQEGEGPVRLLVSHLLEGLPNSSSCDKRDVEEELMHARNVRESTSSTNLFFVYQFLQADVEREQGDLSTTAPFRPRACIDNASGVEIYRASNE
ncbi:hypothetical protein VNO77_15615 [Canavalia gladiata]|uniref:Uncharacterized protein n=1 Tax=Canavalia gladiata TaxID=3824 RepID=A0AAN9QRG3_CANGL